MGYLDQLWEDAKKETEKKITQVVVDPLGAIQDAGADIKKFGSDAQREIGQYTDEAEDDLIIGHGNVEAMKASQRALSEGAKNAPAGPIGLPEVPTPENSAPQIDEAKKKQRRRTGRASTILTGGQGRSLLSSGGSASRRTLQGA